MKLSNHYDEDDDNDNDNNNNDKKILNVEIDIGLTADQNVRKYFENRKNAIDKQQKTLAASNKAIKSAQVQIKSKINQVCLFVYLNFNINFFFFFLRFI